MGVELLDLAQPYLDLVRTYFELAKTWVQTNPKETIIAVQALVILRLYFRRPKAMKVKGRTVEHVKAYKFKTKNFRALLGLIEDMNLTGPRGPFAAE